MLKYSHKTIEIDCNKIIDFNSFFEVISDELSLPEYAAKDLSGLHEFLLTEINLPMRIVWRDFERIRDRLGESFAAQLQDLLKKTEAELEGSFISEHVSRAGKISIEIVQYPKLPHITAGEFVIEFNGSVQSAIKQLEKSMVLQDRSSKEKQISNKELVGKIVGQTFKIQLKNTFFSILSQRFFEPELKGVVDFVNGKTIIRGYLSQSWPIWRLWLIVILGPGSAMLIAGRSLHSIITSVLLVLCLFYFLWAASSWPAISSGKVLFDKFTKSLAKSKMYPYLD